MVDEIIQLELPFDQEEWRDIEGYEGMYQISNLGRVKSLARKGRPQERILLASNNGFGYLVVTLCRGTQKTFKIHTLVVHAFIGIQPSKHQVNHIDGNKENNALSNLEYCTPQENTRHAWESGLCTYTKKLTAEDVIEIRRLYNAGGTTHAKLGKMFGVHDSMIGYIVRRKNWQHIPD